MVVDPVELQRRVRAVDHPADIGDAHWRTIAIGDDNLAQRIYLQQLTVGANLVSRLRALEGADRLLDRVVADRRGNIVHADPAGRQRCRVKLDSGRVFLLAEDHDLPDARQHRDALCDIEVGVLIELVQGHDVRGQTQDEHRLISRIDLFVGRRVGQLLWQQSARGVDRGLDIRNRRSMLRDRSNTRVMLVVPCTLVEVI